MRISRFAWLLIPLLLIGVYFLQQSTRAQARVTPAIPVVGAPIDPMQATEMVFSGL